MKQKVFFLKKKKKKKYTQLLSNCGRDLKRDFGVKSVLKRVKCYFIPMKRVREILSSTHTHKTHYYTKKDTQPGKP